MTTNPRDLMDIDPSACPSCGGISEGDGSLCPGCQDEHDDVVAEVNACPSCRGPSDGSLCPPCEDIAKEETAGEDLL